MSTPEQRQLSELGSSHGVYDFTLQRMAGGPALEALCDGLSVTVAPYQFVDLRGPTDDYEFKTKVDVVDNRGVWRLALHEMGLDPEELKTEIAREVPSTIHEQSVNASGVSVHTSRRDGSKYVTLEVDGESVEQIRMEKIATWNIIADAAGLSLDGMGWIRRRPDIRLAYVPRTDFGDLPISIVDEILKKIGDPRDMAIDLGKAIDKTPDEL
ncbi:MAG: hypothetical protein ACHQT9_00780 [Candidatus Saccharimonadales bacterium]